MNLTLLIVVILTAIALVGIALGVARIVSPRSYNRQKGMYFPHQKCQQFCHNHQPKGRTLCCLAYLLPPQIPISHSVS